MNIIYTTSQQSDCLAGHFNAIHCNGIDYPYSIMHAYMYLVAYPQV